MPTALITGSFGRGNPGDEALLTAARGALPAGWDAVATSATPADTASRHGLAVTDAGHPAAVAEQLRHVDALVVAGGTVFKALHPATGRHPTALLRNAVLLVAAARAAGIPVALVGVGADELPSRATRWLARRLVASCDLLVLRDEESADHLAAAGAPTPFWIGGDLAWSLLDDPAVQHVPQPRGRRTVLVALSWLAGGERLADHLAAWLEPLVHDHRVLVQPWQVDPGAAVDDTQLAVGVRRRLGGQAEIVAPPRDLPSAAAQLAEVDVVLAMRFHAAVTAASVHTPFVAVAHEAKLAGVARRLGQPAVTTEDDPRTATARLRDTAARPAGDAAFAVERERSRSSLRMLDVLLTAGSSYDAEALDPLRQEPAPWGGRR